jgi:hypothetical protein
VYTEEREAIAWRCDRSVVDHEGYEVREAKRRIESSPLRSASPRCCCWTQFACVAAGGKVATISDRNATSASSDAANCSDDYGRMHRSLISVRDLTLQQSAAGEPYAANCSSATAPMTAVERPQHPCCIGARVFSRQRPCCLTCKAAAQLQRRPSAASERLRPQLARKNDLGRPAAVRSS